MILYPHLKKVYGRLKKTVGIKSCKLRIIKIPFVVVFKHFLKSRSEVESVIVEIELDSGEIGYGEAVPRDYVTGETIESVKANLLSTVFPKANGLKFKDSDEVISFLREFEIRFKELGPKDLCVRTAFELALLDAIGKRENKSVLETLGGNKSEKIIYSGIVSAEKPLVVKQFIKKFKKWGINQIKLKVGKDLKVDLKNIKTVRTILGDNASIRVDANEGLDLASAREVFPEYIELGVMSVEQPLPAARREDYIDLMKIADGKIDICIDESLCSMEDAQWFIDNRGATFFNMRISKNGGILNSLKIYQKAKDTGIKCQLGAQVGETSLLSSAGRIFAAITGDLMFHEGSFGTLLLAYDLTKNPLFFEKDGIGTLDVFDELPGIGVTVDRALLERMTVQTFE